MQILVLVAAVISAVTTPAPTDAALPIRDVPVAEATSRPGPVIHRQCDSRWQHAVIQEETLCQVGCLFFALCHAAQEEGIECDPLAFLAYLNQYGVFNEEDRVEWQNIARALPFRVITRARHSISASRVREHVAEGKVVLLEVRGSRRRGSHWVFVVRIEGDEIIVDDSRDGARVSFSERYRNHTIGFAILERRQA